MYKILLSLLFLTWLCFVSCLPESDNPNPIIEITFCDLLEEQNVAGIGDITNIYFDSLEYTDFDLTYEGEVENIQNFVAWLDAHDCVDSVSASCVSCVLTNPPVTEVFIRVKSPVANYEKVMDVEMSVPLRFGGFH